MKGSVRKRGKNAWELTIDLGEDANGKRIRKFVTEHCKTKAEADRKLRDLLSQHDKGLPIDTSKLKVAEYMEKWLTDYATVHTRARTVEGYRGITKRYIVPALGNVRLSKLQPADIEAMEAKMLERGLSPRTVQHTHRVIFEALKHAMKKWRILYHNPAESVDPPRVTKNEPVIPPAEGVHSFLRLAEQSPFYALFYFVAYTGCRKSEALGLRWKDVDLDSGMASIVQGVHRVIGKGIITEPPKSGKSRRAVALDPETVIVLRLHRTQMLEHRLRLGEAYQDNGLVFADQFGRPINPEEPTRIFRLLADRIGLKGVRLHDLRHFHATALLKAGTHPKVVQERLGHATISVTLDTYSHVLPGLQEQAALAFAAVMDAAKKRVSE